MFHLMSGTIVRQDEPGGCFRSLKTHGSGGSPEYPAEKGIDEPAASEFNLHTVWYGTITDLK